MTLAHHGTPGDIPRREEVSAMQYETPILVEVGKAEELIHGPEEVDLEPIGNRGTADPTD